MGMISPLLPLELLERVVDEIREDVNTLKACSVTCRGLLPSCRKYIFFKITLDPPLHPSMAFSTSLHRKFTNLIFTNRLIASYVRELEFKPHNPPPAFLPPQMPYPFSVSEPNIQEELPLALPKLLYLETLRYSNIQFLRWEYITPGMKAALHHLVHLPTFRHLELGLVASIPVSFFHSLSNLKSLHLARTQIVMGTVNQSEHAITEISKSSLNSLFLVGIQEEATRLLFYGPQSIFQITNLQRLVISPNEHFQGILEHCGSSVKHLECLAPTGIVDPYIFTNFTSLSSLAINVAPFPLHPNMMYQLNTLPAPTLLETLTIYVENLPRVDAGKIPSAWLSDLDAILANFKNLREVNVTMKLFGAPVDAYHSTFVNVVNLKMVDTLKRGILKVGSF